MSTLRLRHVAQINPPTPGFDRLTDDEEVTFVPLEAVWPGTGLDVSQSRPKAQVSNGYTRFRENDILVPKITPTFEANRATIARGLLGRIGAGTTELHIVRPGPNLNARYANYLLASRPFLLGGKAVMKGVAGQQRVPDEWLRGFQVPVEDVAQQRAISDFLDAEAARIDSLIGKKLRLVSLLRQRLSTLADGRISDLLSTAERVRLQRVVSEVDVRLGSDDPPQLLLVSIHEGVVPREQFTDRLARADELTAYKRCRPGDLILNRMRAFQGGVGRAPVAGIVSPDYSVIRPKAGLDDRYLNHLARSRWFIGEMTARLRGIGGSNQGNVRTPRINFADLRLIEIPLPPLEEQRRLADRIEQASSAVRLAADKLQLQIDRIAEHRLALVTAAVTGQLKVPGMV